MRSLSDLQAHLQLHRASGLVSILNCIKFPRKKGCCARQKPAMQSKTVRIEAKVLHMRPLALRYTVSSRQNCILASLRRLRSAQRPLFRKIQKLQRTVNRTAPPVQALWGSNSNDSNQASNVSMQTCPYYLGSLLHLTH